MFDADEYLRRIGCPAERGVDAGTLRRLHKRHLMALPYNSSAPVGASLVDLDEDALFETTVVQGLGGACFQLNRLFHRLLAELGYEVTYLAASTAEGRENFGTDVEHMFIKAVLDGAGWLVDVGYPGPSYVEPLRIVSEAQSQYGCQYKLVETGAAYEVRRRTRTSMWSVVYTVTMVDRELDEWRPLDALPGMADPSLRPEGLSGIMCGRTLDDGQEVLKGRRHLVVRDGYEQVRSVVDDEEHHALVKAILTGPR